MTTNFKFLCNAFSLQMLNDLNAKLDVKEIDSTGLDLKSIPSAIGHPDTAAVLGVECNRANVKMNKGESVLVVQLMGGRLPEGCTTLPEGYSFKFISVTLED